MRNVEQSVLVLESEKLLSRRVNQKQKKCITAASLFFFFTVAQLKILIQLRPPALAGGGCL